MPALATAMLRSLPAGLAGMVALVVAVEAGLARHRGDWATPTARCFAWSHRASVAKAKSADVVILGDSVLKFGVAPLTFEAATGRRLDNWATTGNPPAVALTILRAHLAAGGRPRVLLVDFKPFLLAHGTRPEADAWEPIATLGDILGLAHRSGDWGLAAEVGLTRAFPSVRDRLAIRGRVRSLLAGQGSLLLDLERPLAAARERNWKVNRGGWLRPPVPGVTLVPEFFNESANLQVDWSCLPGNAATIAEFLRAAARAEIPVVWLITPIHPRLQAGRDRLGIDARFTDFVRHQRDQAPGRVRVVDARRLGLAADRFVDATHLDRRGALAFTQALARALAERPDLVPLEPWTTLEPLSPVLADLWSADPLAEDTDRSAAILGEAARQVAAGAGLISSDRGRTVRQVDFIHKIRRPGG